MIGKMKRILSVFILLAALVMLLSSCERRCVCTYSDGSQDIIYSAYSKQECREWDTFYSETLGYDVDCVYKSYY